MADDTPGFDHLIHWIEGDLDLAGAAYTSAGLPVHDALTMPGFRNSAWGIDDVRYVELATVTDWDAVTTSKYAAALDVLKPAVDALGGSGLITFAVNVPDAKAKAEELRTAGHDVEEAPVWFEDRNAGFLEVFVRDVPSYFPFFITYNPPRLEIGEMRAVYREENGIVDPPNPAELVALLVRSSQADADARLLAEIIGVDVEGTTVKLRDAEVRFEQGESAGLYGFVVHGLEVPGGEIEIDGVVVRSE